eukprot:s91_g12.t1
MHVADTFPLIPRLEETETSYEKWVICRHGMAQSLRSVAEEGHRSPSPVQVKTDCIDLDVAVGSYQIKASSGTSMI